MDIRPEPLNHPDSCISACKKQTSYAQQPLRREQLKAENILRRAEDDKLFWSW